MSQVIAIDPGGTTGVAIRIEQGRYVTVAIKHLEQLYNIIWTGNFSHMIMENFQAETISKWGLHTVRVVGGCYAIALKQKITYVQHVPQNRYAFQEDAKDYLKVQQAATKLRFVIHEEDALAHLFRWEYDNGFRK